MTTDIDKLRELAVASIEAAINFRADKTSANLKITSDLQDAFDDAMNEAVALNLMDALEAANKRIAELENKIAIEEGVFS